MGHLPVFYRIWIYDPGHYTPYYNAGLCGQFAAMGLSCTLLTSPPAFEAVTPAGYEVWLTFFGFLQGPVGAFLRRRPTLRWIVKAVSYPAGVWRTYRALERQEPGVFHIHFAVSPILDALLARLLHHRGWQVVYTLQQPHPENAWNRWQFGRLIDACDCVVMHGEGLAARLREIFPRSAPKIASLTHGTDLPELPSDRTRESARAGLGVSPGEPLLLFFGLIKPYKGLEELLDAMPAVLSRMPKTRLCIAGEPLMDMQGAMEKIARLPAGTVIPRLGFVPQGEVDQYFAAADLVVAGYREIAASSVVLQAQAHAKPVLVTRVGAMPALVDEGRCGFIAGNDLAESIATALSDPDHLLKVGRLGRERVEKMHSWESVAKETLGLYPVKAAATGAPHR